MLKYQVQGDEHGESGFSDEWHSKWIPLFVDDILKKEILWLRWATKELCSSPGRKKDLGILGIWWLVTVKKYVASNQN